MSLPNTHFGAEQISAFLDTKKCIFFAGIGGVSMNSLAHISKLRGHTVCGYDRTPSALTKQLTDIGVPVWYESDASHIDGVDVFVYTVAIPADLPEYVEALRRGIPVISRADYLGYIMSGYARRIGVSGVHGKSTTTSMLQRVFRIAGCDPTVSCGAPMKDADYHCDRIGGEQYFIFEACEYMDSFLDFYPTDALVLNIEADHLDYFSGLAQIKDSFSRFIARTGKDGTAYLNIGDENVRDIADGYNGNIVTFGVGCPNADYSAEDISYEHGLPAFTVVHRGTPLCRIGMHVPGEHNICNALAAAAVALTCGIAPQTVSDALAGFEGAVRRMDYKGKTESGADVYDDYAHHPTEIRASLAAAAAMDHRRIFCVFQPHTYSRTKELFDDFAVALAHREITEILLAEIYSARETDTRGVSSPLLAEAVRERGGRCRAVATLDEIVRILKANAESGDMILVMGAGDIGSLCEKLTFKQEMCEN